MKIIVVCNPGCGKQNAGKYRDLITTTLSKEHDVTYVESKSLEDYISIIEKACAEYEAIIVMGGDGTFHHSLNAMNDYKGIVGYIPRGTSCDMGKNFNTKKKVKKALKVILENNQTEYTFLKINDMKVAYVVSSGKFVATSYATSSKAKKLGRWIYLFRCIPELFRRYKLHCKVDGKEYTGKIVTILNTRCIFGSKFGKQTNTLMIIKKHPLWSMFMVILTKKIKQRHCVDLIPIDGKELEFDFDVWSVDGEKKTLPKKFTSEAYTESFKVITGK